MIISGAFFDGKTSRCHAVELMYHNGLFAISGDIRRSYRISEVHVLERVGNMTRKLAFYDGAYMEVTDTAAFDAFLAENGYRDPIAIRMHHSWRWVLIVAAILVSILVPGYLYGLPLASEAIAKRMPEKAQRAIGREALEFLDKKFFSPSEMPAERQQAIVSRFMMLTPPKEGTPTYEILFRKSSIGPNAFALPSGQIIMTDELVKLLGEDDAVMGVLAHELGHLHERHMLRRIIQGSVVGLVSVVLMGDASSVVTAIPTTLLDLKYSRDAEREADNYAIAMMQANGISLEGLVLTFEKLGKKSPEMSAYLSSHPPAAERVERVRRAE
jgi:Zn-dependent protease with chaperone function